LRKQLSASNAKAFILKMLSILPPNTHCRNDGIGNGIGYSVSRKSDHVPSAIILEKVARHAHRSLSRIQTSPQMNARSGTGLLFRHDSA
jgi:hypothetical protein